jgi:hypothetical protein
MVLLWPRKPGISVVEGCTIDQPHVEALTSAAEDCWEAIMACDLEAFAAAYQASFEAQINMFPAMMAPGISDVIDSYRSKALAWKMAGAGGGGYLALVCEKPLKDAIRIKIRRRMQE